MTYYPRLDVAGCTDGGRPWPPQHMTTEKWWWLPTRWFRFSELTLTQTGTAFRSLLTPEPEPYSGDPICHVVIWEGVNYLEDGHHRLMRAMCAGHKGLTARYLEVR